jgi:hypothetical protein
MPKEITKESKSKKANKTLAVDLLDSYRKALYRVRDYFDSLNDIDEEDVDKTQKTMAFILKCGADLGKNIETLAVLEKKVQAEEATNSKIRGGSKLSLLEEGELD